MPQAIQVTLGNLKVQAQLNDGPTAQAVIQALPIEAAAQRWGQEIYFSIPVQKPLEQDAQEVLEPGTLGYWPSGNAFCIFWGPTPASQGQEIRAASAVNIIGSISGDFDELDSVPDGASVLIENL